MRAVLIIGAGRLLGICVASFGYTSDHPVKLWVTLTTLTQF